MSKRMKSLLLLVAASLFTQREFAQEVTFKTETKLVIVNVSVKGKDGKPLTTLKKEDIEIYEDGVKQRPGRVRAGAAQQRCAGAGRGDSVRSGTRWRSVSSVPLPRPPGRP